jgi:tRNA A37 methylthiotransferase MiaB
MTGTADVVPYFDLSFQHSAPAVLRRMRRFGNTEQFLELLRTIRDKAPQAGARSNFIVGFPGETEEDYAELERFISEAGLDAIGVFGYSDEDGTEAATFDGKLPEDVVAERLARLTRLAEELTAQRAEQRIGTEVEVLVESLEDGEVFGRASHQAPETDGLTSLVGADEAAVGQFYRARVIASEGVDLVAEVIELVRPAAAA